MLGIVLDRSACFRLCTEIAAEYYPGVRPLNGRALAQMCENVAASADTHLREKIELYLERSGLAALLADKPQSG